MREAILENMEYFGMNWIKKPYRFAGIDGLISKTTGKVKVLSVTTNEELVIALDTINW
jgi:acetate kinase